MSLYESRPILCAPIVASLAGLCLAACGPDRSDGSTDAAIEAIDGALTDAATVTDASPDTLEDAATDPSAPRIVRLSVNDSVLEREPLVATESLVVTAVVTDPQGITDLIGGELIDPESRNTYGAFGTTTTPGTYEIRVDWMSIGQVRPIDAPANGGERVFEANFFDQAGHLTRGTVSVQVRCTIDSLGLCDGECIDLSSDPAHCGECRRAVAPRSCVEGEPACASGTFCAEAGACVDLRTSPQHCGACGVAVDEGQTCVRGAPRCRGGGDLACRYMGRPVCISEGVRACGGCDRACAMPADAAVDCVESRCVYSYRVAPRAMATTGDEFCREQGYTCIRAGTALGGALRCDERLPSELGVSVVCVQ